MNKWFIRNARKRAWFALGHPAYSIRALVSELTSADERFLASQTGSTPAEIRAFMDEPFNMPELLKHLQQCESVLRECKAGSIGNEFYAKKVLIPYAVLRAAKPERVVETGVANGISTTYLLLALENNRKGKLYSVDIGDTSFLPPGRKPGWIVPDWLRSRWIFHLGDSRNMVPRLLGDLGEIDIFFHDSLHTYEHMKFEFEQAYPYIRKGGFLLADDASWNSAFEDFTQAVNAPNARILRGVSVLSK